MTRASLRRRAASYNPDIAFPALVALGQAQAVVPTTDTGYRYYGPGRLFLPATTNLVPDPQGVLANGTFWPASTAHTTVTANLAPPIPLPDELLAAGLTKCLSMVNDATADVPNTAVLTVVVSKDYWASLYVYAPTIGGTLTITTQATGASTIATIAVANAGWTRYIVKHTTGGAETTLHLHFSFAGGTASTVYVSGAQIAQDMAPTPFFCGLMPACAWAGTVNASASTRTGSELIYPLSSALTNAAGTIALRTVPLYAGDDGLDQHRLLVVANAAADNYTLGLRKTSGNVWRFTLMDGTPAPVSSAAVSFAAGTTHSIVARYNATSSNLTTDGTAADQVTHGRTLAIGTSFAVHPVAAYAGGAANYHNGDHYIGPYTFSPYDIGVTNTATLDAMLTAGATALDLFRFFRERSYWNTLVLPLVADSLGYIVR